MAARKTPVDPAAALEAAKAEVARKVRVAPETLTEADLRWVPGKTILALGNAGRLQHLGLGIPPPRSAAPKVTVSRSASDQLTDAQIARMDGNALSKAMASGKVPGIGARRRPRGR